MADKNRQHYVPKFYLRNFSENERAIDTFNLTNSKYIQNASIKDMCQRHNFYGADNRMENYLAEVESRASMLIKNVLRSNKFPEIGEDYLDLFQFLLISEARNLKIAESTNYAADYIAKLFIEKHPEFKDLDLDAFKLVLKEPSTMNIAAAVEGTKFILDLRPLLIIEKTGGTRRFITSDNPLIRYNSFYLSKKYPGGFGLMVRGLQLFFPITPHKCILLYDSMAYDIPNDQEHVLYLNKARDVDQLNELFFLNAHNNVFFNQKVRNSYIEGLHYKLRKEPRVGDTSREIQAFNAVDPREGKLLHFSPNRVQKLFNFSWLKLSQFASGLAVPNHMGGLQRTESPYIQEQLEEDKLEYEKERPPFKTRYFRA